MYIYTYICVTISFNSLLTLVRPPLVHLSLTVHHGTQCYTIALQILRNPINCCQGFLGAASLT